MKNLIFFFLGMLLIGCEDKQGTTETWRPVSVQNMQNCMEQSQYDSLSLKAALQGSWRLKAVGGNGFGDAVGSNKKILFQDDIIIYFEGDQPLDTATYRFEDNPSIDLPKFRFDSEPGPAGFYTSAYVLLCEENLLFYASLLDGADAYYQKLNP